MNETMTDDTRLKSVAWDLETIADRSAIPILDPVEAAGNLKDPAKIAADIAAKEEKRLAELGLNPYTCRICCFGSRSREAGPATMVLADEDDGAERELLRNVWVLLHAHNYFITFNGLPFDLPVLLARSLILGVEPTVTIDRGKYVVRNHVDLRNLLTNGDKFMKGRLGFFAQRILGRALDTDPGSAVQGHWDDGAEGRAKIASHCAEDVSATWDLYERLVDSGCYDF